MKLNPLTFLFLRLTLKIGLAFVSARAFVNQCQPGLLCLMRSLQQGGCLVPLFLCLTQQGFYLLLEFSGLLLQGLTISTDCRPIGVLWFGVLRCRRTLSLNGNRPRAKPAPQQHA
jgi:hypothetical protein